MEGKSKISHVISHGHSRNVSQAKKTLNNPEMRKKLGQAGSRSRLLLRWLCVEDLCQEHHSRRSAHLKRWVLSGRPGGARHATPVDALTPQPQPLGFVFGDRRASSEAERDRQAASLPSWDFRTLWGGDGDKVGKLGFPSTPVKTPPAWGPKGWPAWSPTWGSELAPPQKEENREGVVGIFKH